jgi:hypothetical protein
MKKLILSLVAIATLSLSSFGQAPEGFKYQAVLRDAGNLILNNQAVGMRLTVQQGSIGGTAVYTETFAITTNTYGLVNLEIGTGTTTDDFSIIDWSAGPYFIETAVDVTGGTSYAVMGTSQLMSVPYALYAKTAENVTNDLVDDADADPNNEIQTISRTGTTVTLSNGGGTFEDSVGVYTAGTGIDITNNVISTSGTCGLSIGDTYQGGIIFYLDASGCHGLISASTDQSTGIQWFNGSYTVTNAVRDGIEAGGFNTERIIANQGTGAYAAQICANHQGGNYGDWYLPSKYELNLMYQNIGQGNALGLGNVGGFASYSYWSSTELDNYDAWVQLFSDGYQYGYDKYTFNYYVRAVRAF